MWGASFLSWYPLWMGWKGNRKAKTVAPFLFLEGGGLHEESRTGAAQKATLQDSPERPPETLHFVWEETEAMGRAKHLATAKPRPSPTKHPRRKGVVNVCGALERSGKLPWLATVRTLLIFSLPFPESRFNVPPIHSTAGGEGQASLQFSSRILPAP